MMQTLAPGNGSPIGQIASLSQADSRNLDLSVDLWDLPRYSDHNLP